MTDEKFNEIMSEIKEIRQTLHALGRHVHMSPPICGMGTSGPVIPEETEKVEPKTCGTCGRVHDKYLCQYFITATKRPVSACKWWKEVADES